MHKEKLVGKRVMHVQTHQIGKISHVTDEYVLVNCRGNIIKYAFPEAFTNNLVLEDEYLQKDIQKLANDASFETFKKVYKTAVNNEISFLKANGGKKYRILDGVKVAYNNGVYLYAFDTDSELHFPEGTAIRVYYSEIVINAYIAACEDFTILFRTDEYIGEKIDSVEIAAEQWFLLESLIDRIDEMTPAEQPLAYKIACEWNKAVMPFGGIQIGQNAAINRAISEDITFIWGPPGTGKTETLAKIALEHIEAGRRVLMLSYSNVSVDGAILRLDRISDLPKGSVIRYGYPRKEELINSEYLTSYQYILHNYPELSSEYKILNEKKKKLKRNSVERIEINKQLNKIRRMLLEQESKLIQHCSFVATTVSKATVDRAIYSQVFDVVIFDEASMAYVPQIIFAAGLAKSFFVCLGDFCQLPAIVQNPANGILLEDIFDYTGITEAVEEEKSHDWLVMLSTQFRMHQDISDFVSELMYHGKLITADGIYETRKEIASRIPCPDSALSMVNTSGMYTVCKKTNDGSHINILSAMICIRLAELNLGVNGVGIITPYSAQSRLILSMIRDLQEHDQRWKDNISATVHQFQGSEKDIIIYDAVDCFRMPYPGTLLTSVKNNMANRLFNVAVTRARGKFVLVANMDFFKRKKISKKLMFQKCMSQLIYEGEYIKGDDIIGDLYTDYKDESAIYVSDKEDSWDKYVDDISKATKKIQIDIPDVLDDNSEALEELINNLDRKRDEGIEIRIRVPEELGLPSKLEKYCSYSDFITCPVTIIDNMVVWYGQPLYAADFVSEGEIIDTDFFISTRFVGAHTARSVQAFLEL